MNRRTLTMESTFNDHPIMTDKNRKLACDTNILQEIQNQMDYAEQTKTKIFCLRMDVRFPVDTEPTDNGSFSKFQSAFMKNLSRQGLEPQYVAVREQRTAKHQHYHEQLFLDGQKTQNIANHIKTAERLWNKTLGLGGANNGLIDACLSFPNGVRGTNGIMLDPNAPEYEQKRDEVFRRASYLAKENTKGNVPHGQRELFSSRIPKKGKSSTAQ